MVWDKCPNCGSSINIRTTGLHKCMSCNHQFDIKELPPEPAKTLNIADIYSGIDVDGTPATFVLLKGCPGRCVGCKVMNYAITTLTINDVIREAKFLYRRRLHILGSPLVQAEGVSKLMEVATLSGMKPVLQICGIRVSNPQVLRKASKVIFDVPTPSAGIKFNTANYYALIGSTGLKEFQVRFTIRGKEDYKFAKELYFDRLQLYPHIQFVFVDAARVDVKQFVVEDGLDVKIFSKYRARKR